MSHITLSVRHQSKKNNNNGVEQPPEIIHDLSADKSGLFLFLDDIYTE